MIIVCCSPSSFELTPSADAASWRRNTTDLPGEVMENTNRAAVNDKDGQAEKFINSTIGEDSSCGKDKKNQITLF